MKSVRRVLSQLMWWARPSARNRTSLQAEIDEHLALQTADNIRAGLAPTEARRQALLKFGGVEAVKEALQDQRDPPFWRWLTGLWRDLAHAARSLARARAFTFICVVSLGIGMGPVIAIPYASRLTTSTPPGIDAKSMVQLVTTTVGPHRQTDQWSYPDYVDLRDAETGVTLFAWVGGASDVTFQDAPPVHAAAMFAPANYLKTIGIPLARGAGLDVAADDPASTPPIVVLSDGFWRSRLAADRDIVGKTLTMDGIPHVVVGVTPEGFDGHMGFDSAWDVYLPLERHPNLQLGHSRVKNLRDDRSREWLVIHGRLKPGVSVEQANTAVSAVTAGLANAYPATNEFRAGVALAYDPLGSLARPQLRILQAVGLTLTGTVLLVIALNISGMMQVRSAIRERELSIRQAVGATRARLAQHLLAEAVILAGAGGLLASFVLFNIPTMVPWLTGEPIPSELREALRVDASMVAMCIGLCLITSLVFGFLPATRFSRPIIISAMKDEAGVGGLRVGRVHRVTTALQVAIAVPLLVMGGISLDRVRSTATQDLGFDAELLYTAPLKLDDVWGEDASARIRRVSRTLAQRNDVVSVTVADGLPLDFRYRNKRVAVDVGTHTSPRWIGAHVTRVGDGYLKTMGIPLAGGRDFTDADTAGAQGVTIISKALVDKLFPNGAAEPIGTRLTFGVAGADDQPARTLTIVGVSADFPTSQMSTTREQLLVPLAQHADLLGDSVPIGSDIDETPHLMVIARSAPGESPLKMTAAVETVMREVDPDFPRAGVITGARLRQNSMDDFMGQVWAAGVGAGVILLLSALGIYGVVGLMVATRTREIAVRVALGASRRRVLGLIVLDVLKIVSPGIAVGLLLTVGLLRVNSENMGVSLSDLEHVAYLEGALVATLVAVLASLAPARRAASVPAMVAMRSV